MNNTEERGLRSRVASVLLAKSKFDERQAREYTNSHEFRTDKADHSSAGWWTGKASATEKNADMMR
jgi:hypothetical protein